MSNARVFSFPRVIAHRGASKYAPENTLAAFKKAKQLDISWVEFDVVVSPNDPEQTPYIFHDETLDRTTNKKGNLADYSYNELRYLDAGSWKGSEFAGEHIPTLKEVIDYLAKNNMSANVEIKPLPDQEIRTVTETLRVISECTLPTENILYSSFSVKALKYLRTASPECYLSLLLNDWTPGWEDTTETLRCTSVNVDEKIVTTEKAKAIHNMGMGFFSYTVDDPQRAEQLYTMGVDAVFSNAPDKILI